MKPTFMELVASYPTQPKVELFGEMGGDWPNLVDDDNYDNTCAIRLSVALNKTSFPVTADPSRLLSGRGTSAILVRDST